MPSTTCLDHAPRRPNRAPRPAARTVRTALTTLAMLVASLTLAACGGGDDGKDGLEALAAADLEGTWRQCFSSSYGYSRRDWIFTAGSPNRVTVRDSSNCTSDCATCAQVDMQEAGTVHYGRAVVADHLPATEVDMDFPGMGVYDRNLLARDPKDPELLYRGRHPQDDPFNVGPTHLTSLDRTQPSRRVR